MKKKRFLGLLLATLMILTGVMPLYAMTVDPDGSIPIEKPEEVSEPAGTEEQTPEAQEGEPVKDASEEQTVSPENSENKENMEATSEVPEEEIPEEAVEKEAEAEEEPEFLPSSFTPEKADELSYTLLYLMKHADSRYVSTDSISLQAMVQPVTIARGVVTYNAGKQKGFDVTEKNFIASLGYEVPVYDIDPDSRYYVAVPDVNLGSKSFGSYDLMLTYNNNNGESISGYHYSDSILYIPKSAVDHPKNEMGFITDTPVAIQLNCYFKDGVDSDRKGNADFSKKIPVQILTGKEPKNLTVKADNIFDGSVIIPVGHYRKKDLHVMVNGMMMPLGDTAYDVKDGKLILHSPAGVISNVNVVTESKLKTVASKAMDALIPEAYADTTVTPEQMAYFRDEKGRYVTLNIDLNQIFVGWRGVYTGARIQYSGRSTLGNTGGDNYDESRIRALMNLKGWSNSVKYLYGPYVPGNSQGGYNPQDLVGIWAINSYTLGKNKAFSTSDALTADMLVTNDVEGDGGETEKKTIYEWMKEYAGTLEKNNGQVGNTQSAGQGGNVNSNGIGGFTNFAFQFPKNVKGSRTNLVSSGNAGSGQSNPDISFASDEIDASYYLAASCSHLDDAVASDGDGDATVYVSCLAIGEDYAVFSFVGADSHSQDGAAIYKFKTGAPIRLKKESGNAGISKDNACYADLSGGTYGLYASELEAAADQNRLETFTTGKDGITNEESVASGTYYVKELKAPKNYALNEEIVEITVKGQSEVQTYTVTDLPQNDPLDLVLHKVDRVTGKPVPQGSAVLESAEFEVKYYANEKKDTFGTPARIWIFRTDEKGEVHLQEEGYFVSGDELYKDSEGKITFPVGTYTVKETKAPEGYLLPEKDPEVIPVTSEGIKEAFHTYEEKTFPEQVKRGDLSFIKVFEDSDSEKNMKALANVPFEIISKTTGERHIIVTDENGQFDSSAGWFRHTENTNGNDSAVKEDGSIDETKLTSEAGVWFGREREGNEAKADDSLGAFPYDTYALNELPCKANEGLKLVKGRTFTIRVDKRNISLGTIDDAADRKLKTEAKDEKTGDHNGSSQSEKILDTVMYQGLTEGQSYLMKGVLMDKGTGEPVLIDGKKITAEKEFKAEASIGETVMEFSFPKDSLKGKTVVVFETLEYDGKVLISHEDLEDEGQTVIYPKIGTKAKDRHTGTHEGALRKTVTIEDTVSYQGLVPGKKYTMTGILMDRKKADVLKDEDGNTFVVTQEFTPKKAEGTVSMTFRVPGTVASGKSIVCFEYCEADGIEIAVHAEIHDKEQTVSYQKGEVPKGFIPDTGDRSTLLLYGAVLIAAAAAMIVIRRHKSGLQKEIEDTAKDM